MKSTKAWALTLLLSAVAAAAAMAQAQAESDAEREALQAVVQGNSAFGADLYNALSSAEGNLVLSPLSASAVLALALQGAGGNTAAQLQAALHLPPDAAEQRRGFHALLQHIQQEQQQAQQAGALEGATLRMANALFSRAGAPPAEAFVGVARGSFQAEVRELDFAGDSEAARRTVNAWVENATAGNIRDLFETLDPATLLVLVNAVYFKGAWLKPFEESETKNEPFHLSRSQQAQVPMMHRRSRFGYGALPELGARVIELPYRGFSMRMLVVLPDEVDGLARVEAGLRSLNVTRLSREMSYGEVVLALPKFRVESKFNLEDKLQQLGIQDLFTPAANLSGITSASVQVSKVVQKALVEVTEKGTVAAAATGLDIVLLSAPIAPPQPVIFTADHPFLFLIVDGSGNIIFIGRIVNPHA